MNRFGHGIAFRAAGFTRFPAIVLFALLAGADAASAQSASANERAVLYDEDLSDPTGHQYLGSVKWRTEVTRPAGQSDDVTVVADVDIALRKFKMTLSLKRNFDKSLPASHVVELTFHLPPDFAGGGIGNVPGLLMKTSETARGLPLAGLSVKVTDGFFLVGLSDTPADRERNRQSLLQRAWFDIPIVYDEKRRSIVAIEKGASGDQAFKTAFTAWGQYPAATQAAPVTPDSNDSPGSYVVQVSSQRSEADAQASYKVLQDKFPGVLGAWAPIISRADTGANGVFYRAAVGPFQTADEASQFCATLKAAGGQCVVQRN